MDKITLALTRQFDKHRIVFWYNAKKEFRKEFEALNLPDIEKIELNNNEFSVKHRPNSGDSIFNNEEVTPGV